MEEQIERIVEGLLRDVATTQREALTRTSVLAQVRARPPVRRSLPRRLLSRLPRLWVVLPPLAAAGLCAFWLMQRPVPLTFAMADASATSVRASDPPTAGTIGTPMQAPVDRGLPLIFSDGSSVSLNQGARARVIALDSRGATVQLEKGRAEVSVRHRPNTHWRLQAGTFEVTVTGTRFSIDWDDSTEGLTVTMAEGTVEVRGGPLPGGAPVAVTAGQRFRAAARESRWTLAAAGRPEDDAKPEPNASPGRSTPIAAAPTDPAGDPADERGLPSEGPPAPTAARGPSPSSRSWQVLARSGHYQEALQAAERSGFERACHKLGADDLVQLGDVARLARDAARAEQAYQTARRRFPRNDRPAFALGLVAFEQRQNFRGAARWFGVYVHQYPKGALAHEALGREMESWHRAGEPARARRAARLYLNQTPAGPYAPLARQIVSP